MPAAQRLSKYEPLDSVSLPGGKSTVTRPGSATRTDVEYPATDASLPRARYTQQHRGPRIDRSCDRYETETPLRWCLTISFWNLFRQAEFFQDAAIGLVHVGHESAEVLSFEIPQAIAPFVHDLLELGTIVNALDGGRKLVNDGLRQTFRTDDAAPGTALDFNADGFIDRRYVRIEL